MIQSSHKHSIGFLLVMLALMTLARPAAAQDPLELDATDVINDGLATFNYPSSWEIIQTYGSVTDGSVAVYVDAPEGYSLSIQLFYQTQLSAFGVVSTAGQPLDVASVLSQLQGFFLEGRGLQNETIETSPITDLNGRDYAEYIVTDQRRTDAVFYTLGVLHYNEDLVVLVTANTADATLDRASFDALHATGLAIVSSLQVDATQFTPFTPLVFDPDAGGNTDITDTATFTQALTLGYGSYAVQLPDNWQLDYISNNGIRFEVIVPDDFDNRYRYDLDIRPIQNADLDLLNIPDGSGSEIVARVAELVGSTTVPADDPRFESGLLLYEFDNGTYTEFIFSSSDQRSDDQTGQDREYAAFGILTQNDGTQLVVNGFVTVSDAAAFFADHADARAIISTLSYQQVGFVGQNNPALSPANAAEITVLGGLADGISYGEGFDLSTDGASFVFMDTSELVLIDVASGTRTTTFSLQDIYEAEWVRLINKDQQALILGTYDFGLGVIVQLWDLASTELVYEQVIPQSQFVYLRPDFAEFLADGTQLVFLSNSDPEELSVLDVVSGDILSTAPITWGDDAVRELGGLTTLDDRVLICSRSSRDSDATILAEVDPTTGLLSAEYRPFDEFVNCSAMTTSPDGRWVALSGQINISTQTIFLLDAANAYREVWRFDTDDAYLPRIGPSFSPDGTLLAIATEELVAVVDTATGQVLSTVPYTDLLSPNEEPYVQSALVSFSEDGRLLLVKSDDFPLAFLGVAP